MRAEAHRLARGQISTTELDPDFGVLVHQNHDIVSDFAEGGFLCDDQRVLTEAAVELDIDRRYLQNLLTHVDLAILQHFRGFLHHDVNVFLYRKTIGIHCSDPDHGVLAAVCPVRHRHAFDSDKTVLRMLDHHQGMPIPEVGVDDGERGGCASPGVHCHGGRQDVGRGVVERHYLHSHVAFDGFSSAVSGNDCEGIPAHIL